MLKKMFAKFSGTASVSQDREKRTDPDQVSLAALTDAIEERRKVDPLIGARIGAKEVFRRAVDALEPTDSDDAASLLCALGALAGYACQVAVRFGAEKDDSEAQFMVIATGDGQRYFYGESLNQFLAESRYSVWHVVAGAARHAGCDKLPDISTIFKQVSEDIGSENFGTLRLSMQLPAACHPRRLPVDYLRMLWPVMQPVAELFCRTAEEWPLIFGLAVQEAIYAAVGKGIEPGMALIIVMESAVPMSKIDFAVL